MLYVGIDCHKRYAQLNAIDEALVGAADQK